VSGLKSLLLVPQYEEIAGGKEILFRRESDCENECLFAELCQFYYSEGINKLEQRWTKCISLKENYVEK
jgi:hypothetical protein